MFIIHAYNNVYFTSVYTCISKCPYNVTAELCQAARPAAPAVFIETPPPGAGPGCPTQQRRYLNFPREQGLPNTPRCFKANGCYQCVNQQSNTPAPPFPAWPCRPVLQPPPPSAPARSGTSAGRAPPAPRWFALPPSRVARARGRTTPRARGKAAGAGYPRPTALPPAWPRPAGPVWAGGRRDRADGPETGKRP